MHLDAPWVLGLVLLVPLLFWLRRSRRSAGAIRFSTVSHATQAGHSLRQRMIVVPWILRLLAILCLIIAMARPQKGLERLREINKGIAIEMVVDRSGSMGAEMEYHGENLSRLDVVKKVFADFVIGGRRGLKGRPNDLIGMIHFARYADTICPLTLAHGALPRFLETVKLVQRREEDGTAIGDAIALAAARLKTAEETLDRQAPVQKKDYEIKSKIIILLTDGENNAGKRHPLEAAKLAAEWGIKIYTIGVGGGESVTAVQTLFGTYKVPMGARIDETALTSIAEATGGVYRQAKDAQALETIYKEIDEMERSEIESVRYVDYKEYFAPFAFAGLFCLLVEVGLTGTVFRRLP